MAEADPGTGYSPAVATQLQAHADQLKGQLEALQKDPAGWKAAYIKEHTDPITNELDPKVRDPETAYLLAQNTVQDNYRQALLAVNTVNPQTKPQTPDAARAGTAAADKATADAADAKRLADERASKEHPGLTNKEAADQANTAKTQSLAEQRLSSEDASRQLSQHIEEINAQYRLDMQNGASQERALNDAKFSYQKIKDQLDAKVAANDKEVARKLAEQKLASEQRAQDISQRNTDTSAFSTATAANLKDFIPQGALGDFDAIMKSIGTGQAPQLTGSVAAHPFNAGQVAQGQMAYAPHPVIAAAGQQIAAQVAAQAQNQPTITAPGAPVPDPNLVAANGLYPPPAITAPVA